MLIEKLPALDDQPGEISKKGFQTVDLFSAFAKAGGSAMDRDTRPSPEFNLKEELLIGRVKVSTKTEFPEWNSKGSSKNTPRFYNYPPPQLVGNYENWVFA